MESAERVFAEDFAAARHTLDSGERSYVVTPTGAWCRRVFIVGALTERRGRGDLMQARVADPTGTFQVTAGRKYPDAAETLGYIEPPAFVAVTGRATIRGSGPRAHAAVEAEALRVVDRTARDLWVQKTAGATLDRLEALRRGLQGGGDEQVTAVIERYETTDADLRDMAGMILAALESAGPCDVIDIEPLAASDLLLAALEGEESITVDDAIALGVQSGLSAREARKALEDLLAAGECYQPTSDTIKLI
ncbi:MAG: hypothetical protein GX216_00795 [Methanomicrobiales archaeon]|nr:hypothetical protein [Methanomicrobiales archaeon]